MKNVINAITTFMKDEEGLTSVEYAVGAGFMAVAGTAAYTGLGGAIETSIDAISNLVSGAVG